MNLPPYLLRIDREITEHRQAIAIHQVEIGRLEDARRVMLGIAEKDQGVAPATHVDRLNGNGGEAPVIVARQAVGIAAPKRRKSQPRSRQPPSYSSVLPVVKEALARAGDKGVMTKDIPGERSKVHHALEALRRREEIAYDSSTQLWYETGKRPADAPGPRARSGINQRVLDYIAQAERPVTREEVFERFGQDHPKQTIHNALFYLKRTTKRIEGDPDALRLVQANGSAA